MKPTLALNREHSILNRRQMARAIAFAGAWASTSGVVPSTNSFAAEQPAAPTLNRFPRMMQDWLVRQVRVAHRDIAAGKLNLKTKQDAEAFLRDVRARVLQSLGPLPDRTPLKPEVTAKLDRDGYRIENIIFESRPGFPVTANLYLPKLDHPVPGVIGTCGHSTDGKAAEAYQGFSQGLAQLGFACLIYDPIGQGERLQYPRPNRHENSRFGIGVREHIQAGNQQFLVGENLSMWRAWDGMRALDYLLTRPEIDGDQIGVTGNSGGGTMTTWLAGIESRFTMAAPSCFVTTFLRNVENEEPVDTEQCPPRALALGLEHEDFLLAMAPNPVTILAKERDFFDVRGSREAYARMKHVYELLGHGDQVSLFVGPTDHGYSVENRTAMYQAFSNAVGKEIPAVEPALVIEKVETLQCTESGQIAERQPKMIADFTKDKAIRLRNTREPLGMPELAKVIFDVLKIPARIKRPPKYRILRYISRPNLPIKYATHYMVETEAPAASICTMLYEERHRARPIREGHRALLYISHRSSDSELQSLPWLRDDVIAARQSGAMCFACDVRGIGESQPNTCGIDTFDDVYGCDYFYAANSMMLDRPYLGQKVWDVLRTIDWLVSLGYSEIDLVGYGWGALISTFAGLLDDSVKTVKFVDRLESFGSLATDSDYHMPLAYMPLDILKHFDLSDCDLAIEQKIANTRSR